MMEKFNRTKIVATIGPASCANKILEKMIEAGMNVCRINASHGSYEDHKKVIEQVRSINTKKGCNTAVLVDLQGPKLRIGLIENNAVALKEGNEILITTRPCTGNSKKIYITYPHFPKDVAKGNKVLIDDGKIELKVIDTNRKDTVIAKIVHGGILSSKKGVNLPDTKISLPSLTKKDREDLAFALENHAEWIGLSFVRSAKDIVQLKKIIHKANSTAKVIAKIEKPDALQDIDAIIAAADGLMVARGDLGVEIPMHQIPLIQKMLVNKCILASRPVIIATQMMESMITNFSPTRAEVNDVANAVLDGADAVMLSGETSVGKFPVKAIEHMHKIITTVEAESSVYERAHPPDPASETYLSDSVCYNACLMARQSGASALIGMTHSGYTAFSISSQRPRAGIFIFTDNRKLVNALSLVWGVRTFYYDKYVSTNHTIADLREHLRTKKIIHKGDVIINIASIPMGERGRANMIKLSKVE